MSCGPRSFGKLQLCSTVTRGVSLLVDLLKTPLAVLDEVQQEECGGMGARRLGLRMSLERTVVT